jgi:hypothetical protein
MNPMPEDLANVRKIYFIADDAIGPFRRVVQLLLSDGKIHSFEEKIACDKFIRWLYDHNIEAAKRLESLLNDKDKRNLEVVVFRNDDFEE